MKSADILYVEDNEDYIEFVKRAMGKTNPNLSCQIITTGAAALELIEQQKGTALPKIIMLDINLPDYNGIDILQKLRLNKATKYIPVIMFSSSENPTDMIKALDNGANAYVIKPEGLQPLAETLDNTFRFWLNHNKTVKNLHA